MTLAVLPNFPFKDQLSEATADGYPPENARFDCVATSFAAAIQYYDGGYVSGDELKDAEYGQSYKDAGTALRRYVDDATDLARAKYHVTAVPYNNASTVWLVGRIHTWLKDGHPVIATIPSQWGTAHDQATLLHPPFSTHVICFYGEIAGGLEAMNPWGGFSHQGSDAYWQGRLCEGQIWAVVKEAQPVSNPNPNPTNPAQTASELAARGVLSPDATLADAHVIIVSLRAQIAALKTQVAASQAQSQKQYAEILSLRSQLAAAQAAAATPDPIAAQWLAIGNAMKSGLGKL